MADKISRRAAKRRRTVKKLLSALVTWTCVFVLLFGAGYLALNYAHDAREKERYGEVRELYHSAVMSATAETADGDALRLTDRQAGTPVPERPVTPEPTVQPDETLPPQDVLPAEERQPELLDPEEQFLTLAARGAFDSAPVPATVEPTEGPTAVPESDFTSLEMPAVQDERRHKRMRTTALRLQPSFARLLEENLDTIAWITTGFDVDFPIVWRDNEFYLTHDFDGKLSKNGTIFMDARNSVDMTDDVLLFYGHNMRSGAMFGNLSGYKDPAELVKEPFVFVQSAWEDKPRTYVYFSMFDASMNENDPSYIKITSYNFDTAADKQAYIDEVVSRSIHDIPVDVDAGDQLVLLVTCSYTQKNGRFLLYGRELREGETEQDIRALFAEKLEA